METTLQPAPAVAIHRLGGAAFMLGNLLFLVNKLNEMSRHFLGRPIPDVISGQDGLLILVGQAALLVGYLAFLQMYTPRLGRPGKRALRLWCGGGILLAVGHLTFVTALGERLPPAVRPYAEAFFVTVFFGLLLLLAGLIWFGVLNLRRPVLRRWPWLPLVTGLMGFTGFFLFSGEDLRPTFLVFRTLFALGLFGLGLALWMEAPGQEEVQP